MPLVSNACIYLITGCAAGYLAGLFGVGGGIVIVPVLVFLFEEMAFPHDLIMQIAIGTSMATVAVTAIVSARTHHANGNVDWMRVYSVLPAVIIGVIVGALVCSHVSRKALMLSVIAFELGVAVLFLSEVFFSKEKTVEEQERSRLSIPPFLGISVILGAVSSIVGIAGGTLFVPFLKYCGMTIRRAIGTAAAIGVPVGIVAAGVYLITGLTAGKTLPSYSMGYVYLPAFAGCTLGSFWTTKHGADLSKKMDTRNLKCAFAAVLFLAAGKMILGMR